MSKNFLMICSVILMVVGIFGDAFNHECMACENLETTEKEVELEKEEELFKKICSVELIQTQLLYKVHGHPELQLVDYTVYLSKRIRPPRV